MATVDLYTHAFADNLRMAKSKTLTGLTGGNTYNLIRIPRFALVADVWIHITTAWTGGGLFDVGFTGNGESADPDAFYVDLALTGAGMYRGVLDSCANQAGKYFNAASGVITVTYDSTDVTVTGSAIVYCLYTIIM